VRSKRATLRGLVSEFDGSFLNPAGLVLTYLLEEVSQVTCVIKTENSQGQPKLQEAVDKPFVVKEPVDPRCPSTLRSPSSRGRI